VQRRFSWGYTGYKASRRPGEGNHCEAVFYKTQRFLFVHREKCYIDDLINKVEDIADSFFNIIILFTRHNLDEEIRILHYLSHLSYVSVYELHARSQPSALSLMDNRKTDTP